MNNGTDLCMIKRKWVHVSLSSCCCLYWWRWWQLKAIMSRWPRGCRGFTESYTHHTHTHTHTDTHTHVHAQKASQLLRPTACQLGRQRMYRDTWTFTQHMYNAWQVGWTVLRSTTRLDPAAAVVVYKKIYISDRITHLRFSLAGGFDVS